MAEVRCSFIECPNPATVEAKTPFGWVPACDECAAGLMTKKAD